MKIGNIIALTSIAIVGYAMHAMRSGESSAMGAARGAGREVPSLQQITAKKIAQMLHDREMTIDLADVPQDSQARMKALDTFFHNQTKAIAQEYYKLYRSDFPLSLERVQILNDAAGIGVRFDSEGDLFAFSGIGGSNRFSHYTAGLLAQWSLKEDGLFQFVGMTEDNQTYRIRSYNTRMNRVIEEANQAFRIYKRNKDNSLIGPHLVSGDYNQARLSPDGRMIACMRYGSVDIWSQDLKMPEDNFLNNPYRKVQTIPIDSAWSEYNDKIIFGPLGNTFAIYQWGTNRLTLWRRKNSNNDFIAIKIIQWPMVESHLYRRTMVPEEDFDSATFSADETLLVINQDGKIKIMSGINFSDEQVLLDTRSGEVAFLLGGSDYFVSDGSKLNLWGRSSHPNIFKLIDSYEKTLGGEMAVSANGEHIALSSATGSGIEIWKIRRPSIQEIWDHILITADADMPELEDSPDVETKKTLLPPVEMPALEESPDSTAKKAQSSSSASSEEKPQNVQPSAEAKNLEEQLADIVAHKKAIKANASLTRAQKEEQLNALRARERELKKECKEQGTCAIQ